MNAAARLVHQGVLSRHLMLTHVATWRQMTVCALILGILFSALGVVYITHTSRELYASYQHRLTEQNRLHVERGQLLLERGALMMQARVQQLAEEKLNMVVPDHKSVVIIHE
ncbi:MAG: cell division protein FtsL [Gammaproteobacteria bacterium]|nr:MAG: cell division protein FtsL [Gammaproteobacteria bacterium]